MSKQYVITIGRQYGSGGREIGLKLAEKLGIPFYDKDILEKIAEETGVPEDYLDTVDERLSTRISVRLNSSLSSIHGTPVDYSTYTNSVQSNDQLFRWKSGIIRKLAEEGPCVIVGRCADYILRDYPGLISVFISAPFAAREARINKLYPDIHDNAPAMLIRKTDKARASYYSYHTDRKWSDISNYHLCVDSTKLGVDGTVDMLLDYVKHCTEE